MKRLLFLLFFLNFSNADNFADYSLFHKTKEFIGIKKIDLDENWLIQGTEKIFVDGKKLKRIIDYKINYNKAEIIILKKIKKTSSIYVEYNILPINIKKRYKQQFYEKKIFTPYQKIEENSQLQISGSKSIGINIGNQNLSLNQALRVEIIGSIFANTKVRAILSDQNSPIQPEGTTEEISNLDEILINIENENLGFTLGDYDFVSSTEFFNTYKKLEGVKISGKFKDTKMNLLSSVSQGSCNTIHLKGKTGIQNYEISQQKNLVILAGSEKVWVNGILKTRGYENDYIMEYSQGMIEFTQHCPIVTDDEIVVSFEYIKEDYRQKLYGFVTEKDDKNFSFGLRFFNQADDKTKSFNPLKETDLERLKQGFLYTEDDQKIIAPKSCSVMDFTTLCKIGTKSSLYGEYALSINDKNTFSVGDKIFLKEKQEEKVITGNAVNLNLNSLLKDKIKFKADYRNLDNNYLPLSNQRYTLDYERNWDFFLLDEKGESDLESFEGTINYFFKENFFSSISFGNLTQLSSKISKMSFEHKIYSNFDYNFKYFIKQTDHKITNQYHTLLLNNNNKYITPSFLIEYRNFKAEDKNSFEKILTSSEIEIKKIKKLWFTYSNKINYDITEKQLLSNLDKIDIEVINVDNWYIISTFSKLYNSEYQYRNSYLSNIKLKFQPKTLFLNFDFDYKVNSKSISFVSLNYFNQPENEESFQKIPEKLGLDIFSSLIIRYDLYKLTTNNIILNKIFGNLSLMTDFNLEEQTFLRNTKIYFLDLTQYQTDLTKTGYFSQKYITKIFPQNKLLKIQCNISEKHSRNNIYKEILLTKFFNKELIFKITPFNLTNFSISYNDDIIQKSLLKNFLKDFEQNNRYGIMTNIRLTTSASLNVEYNYFLSKILYNENFIETFANQISLIFIKSFVNLGRLNVTTSLKKTNCFKSYGTLPLYRKPDLGTFPTFEIQYYGKIYKFINIVLRYLYDIKRNSNFGIELMMHF